MSDSLFITGATGFVGRRFLALADLGRFRRVRALVRGEADLPATVRPVHGDLLEAGDWTAAIDPDAVILHLAALTGKGSRREHHAANDEATARLVEAARAAGVRRFLQLSSVAVAFDRQQGYHYAAAKAAAERRVRSSGLDYMIVRPTMVFGPGSPVEEGLTKLATMPLVPLFGGGRNLVQQVQVVDLVRFLDARLDREFAGR